VLSLEYAALYRYQKVSLLSYLGTYFAMGSGIFFTLTEAVVGVLAPYYYDKYAIRGFDIMLTCTIIFAGISLISDVLVRWRVETLKGGE
jgi:hypothetical protein